MAIIPNDKSLFMIKCFIPAFGAEFTKAWILKFGAKIQPNAYAELVDAKAPGEAETKKNEKANDRNASHQKEQHHQKTQHLKPQLATLHKTSAGNTLKKEEKKPGMGMLLVGLVLYFFNTNSKKV